MGNWKHDPDLINEGILMVNTLVNEIMRETNCDVVSVSSHRDIDGIRIQTVWFHKGFGGADLNCMVNATVVDLMDAKYDVLMHLIQRIQTEYKRVTGHDPNDPTELT